MAEQDGQPARHEGVSRGCCGVARIVGARHVTLAGHAHRPEDHPDAAAVVRAFLDGD